jgi:hypothetical protein
MANPLDAVTSATNRQTTGGRVMQYICELIELDFEKGTATFAIPPDSKWTAGKYLIAGRDVEREANTKQPEE